MVGTPIGHLNDMTARGVEVLRQAGVILAEDTRVTRKLLARYDIATRLVSCHKFNEASRIAAFLEPIRAGAAVALVSTAGMPAVSDPGARMVRACREAGLPVWVVPGPSAVTAAIALCGFPAHGFHFEGFLPHKPGPRRRRLTELAGLDLPLVLFESPHRLLRLLDEVEAVLGARELCVAREMTKLYEETLHGTTADIRAAFANRTVRGELTVVIAPKSNER